MGRLSQRQLDGVTMSFMKRAGIDILRLGTSSWSAPSWVGVFYPVGTRPADFLSHYAERYDSVEIDSTFYRVPTASMIKKWEAATPASFHFAAKVPQVITHEKVLVDCQQEILEFIKAMEGLGNKLGPLLLQFPYFNKSAFASSGQFFQRLSVFLKGLPRPFRWAVEIRNKSWLTPELYSILREHQVACALVDQAWMPPVQQVLRDDSPLTAEFSYVRWLGDLKGIEQITSSWDKVVVDRAADLQRWVEPIRHILAEGKVVYGFFNNHYSGHAPASLDMFRQMMASLTPSF
jgi:uncharacterized protein YecE (DUF72 family)